MSRLRIGYAANSAALNHPADRRRFPYYARKRGLDYEVARPGQRYDLLVVTPRADLDAHLRRSMAGRLVFDIVDDYLDIPPHDPKALLRGAAKFMAGEARTPFYSYRAAVIRMLRRADAVTCASPEQAASFAVHNPNVHHMLDFHGGIVRVTKSSYAAGDPVRLVWEGLGHNADWFSEIAEPLRRLQSQHALEVHLVTSIQFRQYVQRFRRRSTLKIASRHIESPHLHQWSEGLVSVIATACDVAVIPLPIDQPFERAKPENKLVSFWRMGLPVVTSATAAYSRVMDAAGVDGTCSGADEWVDALEGLISDQDLRRDSALRGRHYAEERYSDERIAQVWDQALDLC